MVKHPLLTTILDYCNAVWSYCGSVIAEKLEKLQRRAARYASGVILLLPPESFRFFLSYLNFVIPTRFTKQKHLFAQESKTLKESGHSSKMTPLCKLPFLPNLFNGYHDGILANQKRANILNE